MDLYLEDNCQHLIEAIKNSGCPLDDVARVPLDCVFGSHNKGLEAFAEKYNKEIEAVIKFADDYDVDINEFDLSTTEKKVGFALMYMATEIKLDYSTFICVKDD